MGTGGTGDILTGMIAGLVAQFPDRADLAVAAAVYLHGLAGQLGRAGARGEVPDRYRHSAISSRRDGGVCRRTAPRLKRRRSPSANGWRGELPRRGVVLLIGNLGAGKTTLAKGIVGEARRGGDDDVSSPTFTLDPRVRQWRRRLPHRSIPPGRSAAGGHARARGDLRSRRAGADRVGRAFSGNDARRAYRNPHPRRGRRRREIEVRQVT